MMDKYIEFLNTHLRVRLSIYDGTKWVPRLMVAVLDDGRFQEGEFTLPDGRKAILEYAFGAPRTTEPACNAEQLAQYLLDPNTKL